MKGPEPHLIDECVHCGFCLPACPTYLLWREEMDSPRGRIYLMKMHAEDPSGPSDSFVSHFDSCLSCLGCMTACPSGVDYQKLVEATRAEIESRHKRSLGDRLFREMIFALFPHPGRLRLLRAPLGFYQASGLQSLVRRSGLLRLLPERIQALDGLLPRSAPGSNPPTLTPAIGEKRRRVGLLLGCVQRVFFPAVNAATARVLAAEGCEVYSPRLPDCCGALLVHAGREADAQERARQTIDAFEGVETVVINAAGCGSTMKEYAWQLRDDPAYAEKARLFAAKCRDVSELLFELPPRAERHPVRRVVAYHDACHLSHGQRVREQPRSLLAGIPGLQLVEIPEGDICCGSAGIYNLVEPKAARALAERKAKAILQTGAEAIAAGNPGCILQIQSALERERRPLPVIHSIEILDASLNPRG